MSNAVQNWVVIEYRNEKPVRLYNVQTPRLNETGGYYAVTVMQKLTNPKKWYARFYLKQKHCPRRFHTYTLERWQEDRRCNDTATMRRMKTEGYVDPLDVCPQVSFPSLSAFLKAIAYVGRREPWQDLPALP